MKSVYEIITTPRYELTIADQLILLAYFGAFILCVYLVIVIVEHYED